MFENLFAIAWAVRGTDAPECILPPMDCNTHKDQGMLVYSSREAAELAAAYQTEMYAEDEEQKAIAVPLKDAIGLPASKWAALNAATQGMDDEHAKASTPVFDELHRRFPKRDDDWGRAPDGVTEMFGGPDKSQTKEFKVYEVDDGVWWMAETPEQAASGYATTLGETDFSCYVDSAKELSEAELIRLRYVRDNFSRSFLSELRNRMLKPETAVSSLFAMSDD